MIDKDKVKQFWDGRARDVEEQALGPILNPKEMAMPKGDYEFRARKAPEVGQEYFYDPAFPGRVTSVIETDVTIAFSKRGDTIETPFGTGRVREEADRYKVDIDAKEGTLVRTGNKIGRITKGRSSTEQGGKASPSGAGVRPVAFATAVLSMAGLEPSRKELNILGFRPPRFACSSLRPQCFHTVSGVDWA